MTFESKFVGFTAKIDPDNVNKTKSDIFPCDIFKFVIMFFLINKY